MKIKLFYTFATFTLLILTYNNCLKASGINSFVSMVNLPCTTPPAPIVNTPTIYCDSLVLNFSSGGGSSTALILQYDDNTGFTSPTQVVLAVSAISHKLTAISGVIYWRIRAVDCTGPCTCFSSYIIGTPASIGTLDKTVTINGALLSANAPNITYQWINCNGNTIIAGATTQSYTATANGNYAVIITDQSCSDTSDCVNVNSVGLNENNYLLYVSVSPNPSSSEVTLSLNKEVKNVLSKVINMLGEEIESFSFSGSKLIIERGKIQAGIYFIQVISENKIITYEKMVIQ